MMFDSPVDGDRSANVASDKCTKSPGVTLSLV